MNEKEHIKKVYDDIIPSKQLISRTSVMMKEELHKQYPKYQIRLKRYTKQIVAVACLFTIIVTGINLYNRNQLSPDVNPDVNSDFDPEKNQGMKPMSKVVVNISGQIEEVSEEGIGFRLGETWYWINENTEFSSRTDESISRKFIVGKHVSGYTSDDMEGNNIPVDIIYSNQ